MRTAFVLATALVAGLCPSITEAQPLGPRTVLPIHVLCTDLPVAASPAVGLTIAGTQRIDARLALAEGEIAVLSGGTGQGVAVGQKFAARRVRGGLHPYLRREGAVQPLQTVGILTVTAVDDRFALARVESSCDTVDVGDSLEPLAMPTLPTPAAPGGAGQFGDRGRVEFGRDGREVFGDGDILNIDRGSAHGVTPGTRIAIYRDMQNGLPLVPLAEAVVLDTQADHARAVVVQTSDFVSAGDIAVVRAAP